MPDPAASNIYDAALNGEPGAHMCLARFWATLDNRWTAPGTDRAA